jgi:phosphoglucosamine mutase
MGLALKKEGIKLLRTSVGVRYVAECLRQEGLNSGGEKSGHLIFLDHAATGDGTLVPPPDFGHHENHRKTIKGVLMSLMPQILLNGSVNNPGQTARLLE